MKLYYYIFKQIILIVFSLIAVNAVDAQNVKKQAVINMVFTSDAHYGITRHQFRGDTGVAAKQVNAAMINAINSLPLLTLPADDGVNSGHLIANVDYVLQTGDIANRMDPHIQSATQSWADFNNGYIKGIKLKGNNGQPAELLIVPGNHDATNAIGSYKPMKPLIDATAMVNIYNLMMKPKHPLTKTAYDYQKNRINFARDIGGVHFVFITIWPDSAQRVWMQQDIDHINPKTPVVIFAHDPPIGDVRHFSNPSGGNIATAGNQFEFLVAESYKDGRDPEKGKTDIEQQSWVKFLKMHPNIKAYFHGHSNWNEFYIYKGPDNDISLPTFRVDSPMKGKFSSKDETQLSFQLLSMDVQKQLITVRECLWNTKPDDNLQKVKFGKMATISLKVN